MNFVSSFATLAIGLIVIRVLDWFYDFRQYFKGFFQTHVRHFFDNIHNRDLILLSVVRRPLIRLISIGRALIGKRAFGFFITKTLDYDLSLLRRILFILDNAIVKLVVIGNFKNFLLLFFNLGAIYLIFCRFGFDSSSYLFSWLLSRRKKTIT